MNSERPEGFMMIGLHKLAAQNGDGLVPELYELLARRARLQAGHPNVTEFPAWETRPPAQDAESAGKALEGGGDNIIAFPTRAPCERHKDRA
ncbi:hypothetical protein LXM94_24495 [Rhizobium sp. TRM95111]|uniref:hypothetical protein n=1 Tax=Rhizobium alarense TaxID=2846851 RepID=UPI001F48C24E|nr:hypothetical protein [Rhizobium alarense]MCF3643121.1 hypothetical protein [Rhizobium alarense]